GIRMTSRRPSSLPSNDCMSLPSVSWQKRTGGADPMLDVVLIVIPAPQARLVQEENDMLRRRREQPSGATAVAPAFEDFHEWVLSLPWVAEGPTRAEGPGVGGAGV